jgi:hypothetical protein
VVTQASSPLPYTPYLFRHLRLRGVGHPQLAPLLWRVFPTVSCEDGANTTVYKRRPNLVQEVHTPAELHLPWSRLVFKHFGWRGGQHFFFSPLKRSKAMKSYRTACHLLAHGLLTPMPLGAFEVRCWGFIQHNVYVTEALTDAITLRKYCTTMPDGVSGMEEVLRLAAAYTRRLHDSGLWHRDMSLGNFLMTGPPGQRRLYLVDLNRARRLAHLPTWMRALDLARMDWQTWRPQFLALYCEGRFTVQRMLRITHCYTRWRTWRRRVLNSIAPLRRRLGLK